MATEKHTISYQSYENADQLSSEFKALLDRAIEASKKAYSPYSKFNVGASVLLDNGEIIIGSNQENAAYPSGLCAERVALFSANSQYPDSNIIAIAVFAKNLNNELKQAVMPCGSCRQVMSEYEHINDKPITMIFGAGKGDILVFDGVESILPFSFGPDFL